MKVSGNCPVQGYEIRDGWLFYFRARSEWSLRAWAPGAWIPKPADRYRTEAEAAVKAWVDNEFGEPSVYLEDEYDAPEPTPEENDYPGWWSDEYATEVAEWAISEARKRYSESEAAP